MTRDDVEPPMRKTRLSLAAALVAVATATTSLAGATALPTQAAGQGARTCEAPDNRPTVVFLDDDSSVPNRTVRGGCSINDLIDDERTWRSHGLFVAHVVAVSHRLRSSGVVTTREAVRLVTTAARSDVGRVPGYQPLFDGTAESLSDWAYAGDGGFDLLPDGTIRSRTGSEGGFGALWYTPEQFADFSLRLQFRDDAPDGTRGNSGVQVRFPELYGPVEGCPTTFNGSETGNLSWIAVNCGHEVQINDAPDGDPRKTGSIYGFADLDSAESRPTDKGVWNDLEIRVVGQHYSVLRNGVLINEFENLPGIPFPGRPLDPDSSSRGLVGHVGLQAHGSLPDVVSFRNVRIREL